MIEEMKNEILIIFTYILTLKSINKNIKKFMQYNNLLYFNSIGIFSFHNIHNNIIFL